MEIIVDDRERAIIPYLEDVSHTTHLNYKIQRNEVGDYAITYKGCILMVIERKTWTDLAASFRDGRKENILKLLELRERTGCQIAYLIEGDATPIKTKLYSRIPIKNLRAHLDHLAIRDGIHMIYSKNEQYTAERLFELASNYLSLDEIIKSVDETIGGSNADELKNDMNVEVSITEQVLRCLPGVGSIVSTVLAENGITLHSLYHQKYTVDEISTLKYSSGAFLGIERGRKIVEGTQKMINSQSVANLKIHSRILATVPLITIKTADIILQHTTLADILNGSVSIDTLADIDKTEKTKVGHKAANNIVELLVGKIEPSPKIILAKRNK